MPDDPAMVEYFLELGRKWPTEGFTCPWPEKILMDAKTKAPVDSKWKVARELGID